MKQLTLFDGAERFSHVWDLTRRGITEASEIWIALIAQGKAQVLFSDIAKIRLGLSLTDDVPVGIFDTVAQDFAAIVNQLSDARAELKDAVESASLYRLVAISYDGESARIGGRRITIGYALRDSPVGWLDNLAQIKMTHGGLKAAFTRGENRLTAAQRRLVGLVLENTDEVIKELTADVVTKIEDTAPALIDGGYAEA